MKLISDIQLTRARALGKPFEPTDCSEALDISHRPEGHHKQRRQVIRDPLPKVMAGYPDGQLFQKPDRKCH
jgi:hypothetical protein